MRSGGRNSSVDILLSGLTNCTNLLFRGWIDCLKRLVVDSVPPFIFDKSVAQNQDSSITM